MLNSIVLIIPLLLLIVGFEWYISYKKDHHTYTTANFAMNVAIGAMDQVMSLFYFVALYFSLDFVYTHLRFITLGDYWYHWITGYIVVDFLSYWYHRFSHRVNILWAGHVTHHSSEHYNFSNGFRTSFFQGINRIVFWSFLPLFGFSPVMLVVILKVSGLYDFLLHTKYIPKLGFLEKILVTPSQHRVHHGRNDIYIDRNYGSTFVIWDKLFGTFQEETEEVEYGIKGPYIDNNPFMAVGYYYYYLWHAMKTRRHISGKIALLFLPPDRTPGPDITRLKAIRGSRETLPAGLQQYAWFQIACAVPGMILLLLYKDFLPDWQFIIYAAAGIACVGTGAMMLNGNLRNEFESIESLRLGFTTLLIFVVFMFTMKIYVLAMLLFLFLSYLQLFHLHSGKNAYVRRRNR